MTTVVQPSAILANLLKFQPLQAVTSGVVELSSFHISSRSSFLGLNGNNALLHAEMI
jgi:hypothetical protein